MAAPPLHDRSGAPIRVALCIADRVLHERVAAACDGGEIAVADWDHAIDDADIVLADHPIETAAPTIIIGADQEDDERPGDPRPAKDAAWDDHVRAVLPADLAAATLVAVVAVVAAGFAVMPHAPRRIAGHAEAGTADAGRLSSLAESDDDDRVEVTIALTAREREVLALLVEGASNKVIAQTLAVSVHTVKFHVASLTGKLGARNRLEAIAIAVREGVVML